MLLDRRSFITTLTSVVISGMPGRLRQASSEELTEQQSGDPDLPPQALSVSLSAANIGYRITSALLKPATVLWNAQLYKRVYISWANRWPVPKRRIVPEMRPRAMTTVCHPFRHLSLRVNAIVCRRSWSVHQHTPLILCRHPIVETLRPL